MKNIYLIPTENISRLALHWFAGTYSLFSKEKKFTIPFKNIHMYITNDEEIKEGWYFNNAVGVNQSVFVKNEDLESLKLIYGDKPSHLHKIILTTDQDLIADGIQSIDNEFLEWFVNNPGCEYVEVEEKTIEDIEKELNIFGYDIGLSEREYLDWLNDGGELYKINIPEKREPYWELVDKKAELDNTIDLNAYANGVKDGSKWQTEKMYTEEEVYNLLYELLPNKQELDRWFKDKRK